MNRKLSVIFAALALSACQSAKHISGERFVQEYCQGSNAQNTAWSSKFIGHSTDRAYLEYWSAKPSVFGGGTKVHWVKKSELPPAFVGSGASVKEQACGQH